MLYWTKKALERSTTQEKKKKTGGNNNKKYKFLSEYTQLLVLTFVTQVYPLKLWKKISRGLP